ncbi:MAG: electron transfer flavoprotein subunit alpha/FixB family protein, partial [Alphaproteobacteria bacterium]|nr:electron transfer flavoprotein subunit alpha/FixB family protein [Alphaproteobacteria bacterium]
MSVLVIAAHDGKTVRANVANAVTAAGQLGGDVHVLVAGSNAGEAAKSAAAIAGVAKVLQAEDAVYANWLAEDVAPLVVKLAANYGHIVMAADNTGKNLMPRVAALLDVAQVSEAIQIVSPDTFVRPIYAGNAMATVQSSDKIKVV